MTRDELSRRQLLMKTLFGAGLLGLRSLATGIPAAILANPRAALASNRRRRTTAAPTPQFLILATSSGGDPLNANAPGSYVNPQVTHPMDPAMAPTSLSLAGTSVVAAKPWSQLPQALLDRSCFFHHATNTVIHPDQANVMALNGFVSGHEMLVSLLARQLAPALGTAQADPIVLGPRDSGEILLFNGHPEPIISPSSLATLLALPDGAVGNLTSLRDADLDRLNALVKAEGNPGKSSFIDDYALSQREARQLSHDLLSSLAQITNDSTASQIKAAVTLIRMKAAPVVSLHIPFGGDNHSDQGLQLETSETISGVASLADLWSQLVAANLQDSVSFLSFNVFGRTLHTTGDGRDHNGDHNVSLMFGRGFRGGVIGGIETVGRDLGAQSLSSTTGAGVPNGGGDILRPDTLQAMATTFGTGVGVDPGVLAANITRGQVVAAALT
jgi:hypothetical protein